MTDTFSDVVVSIARAGASQYLNRPLRSEQQARWEKSELELTALKLVIDTEVESTNRWHAMHYTGPEDAMEYACKVMTAFGRVVAARRRSKP